jgi:hypothetical protein
MSAFRTAIESKDPATISAALSPEVTFRSPAVHRPYVGRDTVMVILGAVLQVFEEFGYVAHLVDGDEEVLRFRARVGEREVDGVDIVRYGDDGLVEELSVMIRPLSALEAVRQAMAAQLEKTAG